MAKTKTKIAKGNTHKRPVKPSLDSVYFLKLLLYLIVGAQWLTLTDNTGGGKIPLPVGLVIGLLFAAHEHFKIDRKIEYAVLLVAMLIGFFSQAGFFITY